MLFNILLIRVIKLIKVINIVLMFRVSCRLVEVLLVVVLIMLAGLLLLLLRVMFLLFCGFLVLGIISFVNSRLFGVVMNDVVIKYLILMFIEV